MQSCCIDLLILRHFVNSTMTLVIESASTVMLHTYFLINNRGLYILKLGFR